MRILLISLLFLPLTAFCQVPEVTKFFELGISPVSYKGDLSQGYEKWTSAFHVGLKRNNKERLNGHFNLMIGTVTGQNINYTYPSNSIPNNFVKTSLVSINYDLQVNLIKKKNFILYVSQGLGLVRFTPKDEEGNKLVDKFNTRAKNETYNTITVFFPHSIGCMFFLPNNYGVGIQWGRFSPATDYLDNISQLSSYKKPDNIMAVKFTILAPISFRKDAAL